MNWVESDTGIPDLWVGDIYPLDDVADAFLRSATI